MTRLGSGDSGASSNRRGRVDLSTRADRLGRRLTQAKPFSILSRSCYAVALRYFIFAFHEAGLT